MELLLRDMLQAVLDFANPTDDGADFERMQGGSEKLIDCYESEDHTGLFKLYYKLGNLLRQILKEGPDSIEATINSMGLPHEIYSSVLDRNAAGQMIPIARTHEEIPLAVLALCRCYKMVDGRCLLSALRQCEHCSDFFLTKKRKDTGRFCSNKCRSDYWNEKRKAGKQSNPALDNDLITGC